MSFATLADLDGQIHSINDRLVLLKEQRAKLAAQLLSQAPTKSLLDTHGYRVVQTKTKQALTFHYLTKTLEEIIPKGDQVARLMSHIKDRRETITSTALVAEKSR
jgi:hypothetical protein